MFHQRIRGPYEYFLERILHDEAIKASNCRDKHKLSWRYYTSMVIYITLLALFEFSASFAASLWLSCVGLVYGTIQIVIPRQQNSWWNTKEKSWTFGQRVPLVLLIQPIGAIHQNYRSRKHMANADQDSLASEEVYELNSSLDNALLSSRDIPSSLAFSDMFAALELIRPSARSLEVPEHQMPFYTSALFTTLVAWIQIGIAVISGVVFWIDADSIGYIRSHNYYFVLIGLGGFSGAMVLWTVGSIPFSRVFK